MVYSSGVRPERIIGIILSDLEQLCNLTKINRNEALHVWGFGVEMNLQVLEVECKRLLHGLFLASDRRLDMIISGRLPFCHGFKSLGN